MHLEIEQLHQNPLSPLGPPAWSWEIAVYLFLGGITAGLMILSVVIDRRVPESERSSWTRWLPLAAPVLLSLGMLALFLDLEYRLHAYRFYLAFMAAAPMSWGSWILLAIYPATLVFAASQLTDEEIGRLRTMPGVGRLGVGALAGWGRSWAERHSLGLAWANVILGIALGSYTGILLSTLAARAAWNSSILAPLFLVSGLSTGAALMMLFPISHREHTLLRNWDMVAIGAELVLLALLLVDLASGDASGRSAADLLLGGKLTAPFWSLVVIAGLAVPLLVETVELRRKLRPTIFAPALLLIGGLSLRWILLIAGQTPLP